MLVHTLKTLMLMAVTAPPFFLLLTGCTFGAPGASDQSTGIFCNIERGRECATTGDIEMGIDLAKQDEQGFWIQKSSEYGLDYSAAATSQCSGMPQKVLFKAAIPEGEALCADSSSFSNPVLPEEVIGACRAACDAKKLVEPDGMPYRCDHVAWPAHGAEKVAFPGACTTTGTPSTAFQDSRKLPPFKPVVWRDPTNVVVMGNSLRKMSATPAYDAGANATTLLDVAVNGAFEFTATETDRERTAGLAEGPLQDDHDVSADDIKYAVVLEKNGILRVTESGQTKATDTYAAGDTIRIEVMGGIVVYLKNQKPLFSGTATNATVLRVSASLKDPVSTITNARTTF